MVLKNNKMNNNGKIFWKTIHKLKSMGAYNRPGTFGANIKPHDFSKDLKFFSLQYFIVSILLIILSIIIFFGIFVSLPVFSDLFLFILGIIVLIICVDITLR